MVGVLFSFLEQEGDLSEVPYKKDEAKHYH